MTRVKLTIPDEFMPKPTPGGPTLREIASLQGEHFLFNGQFGTVIAGAGPEGAWVRFDGQHEHGYIGCPVKWLEAS